MYLEKQARANGKIPLPEPRKGNTPYNRALKALRRGEEDDALLQANLDGLSLSEAGDRIGMHRSSISRRWKELGLKPNFKSGGRPQPMSPETIEMLKQAHADGLNTVQTSSMLHFSPSTISAKWKSIGLMPNSRQRITLESLGKELVEALQMAHSEGLSIAKTADRLEIPESRVAAAWDKMGLKPNFHRAKRPITEEMAEVLRRLHAERLSTLRTGKLLNCSPSMVARRWREMGLELNFGNGSSSKLIRNEQLIEELQKGLTPAEIAKGRGIDPQILYTRMWRLRPKLKELGIEMPSREKITDEQLETAASAGLRLGEVAELFGVHRTTVSRRWREMGIWTMAHDSNANIKSSLRTV